GARSGLPARWSRIMFPSSSATRASAAPARLTASLTCGLYCAGRTKKWDDALAHRQPYSMEELSCAHCSHSSALPSLSRHCPRRTAPADSDEAAIRELVRRYVDARERIDPQVLDRTRPES